MKKLNDLIQNCKYGINLNINRHRDYNETVEEYFNSQTGLIDDLKYIDSIVYEKMKETNTIVELQYYPDNPVGSYTVHHYDVEIAIDEALKIFDINPCERCGNTDSIYAINPYNKEILDEIKYEYICKSCYNMLRQEI